MSKLLALSASFSLWNANFEIYIECQNSIALEYLLISLTHYRRTEVPSTLLISESGPTKIVTVHCLYRTLSRWGLQSELKWCIFLSYLVLAECMNRIQAYLSLILVKICFMNVPIDKLRPYCKRFMFCFPFMIDGAP